MHDIAEKNSIQRTVILLLCYKLFFSVAESVSIMNFTDFVDQTILRTAALHTALYQLPSYLDIFMGHSLTTCLLQLQ